MKDLQLVVLSRDRPSFLRETLNSLDFIKDYADVVVSDNSIHQRESVEEICFELGIHLVIKENLSFTDHMQSVLGECKSKFLMIFHDDDILCKNFIEEFENIEVSLEEIGAVGFNAYVFDKTFDKDTLFFEGQTTFVNQYSSLVSRYFWVKRCYTPFPFYVYNVGKLKFNEISMTNKFGKYSDVDLIGKIAHDAGILIVKDCVGFYRVHDGQLSNAVKWSLQFSLFARSFSVGNAHRFAINLLVFAARFGRWLLRLLWQKFH